MVRILFYSMVLLSAVVIAVSADTSEPKNQKEQGQHTGVSTTSSPAPAPAAAHAQIITSWEVKADSSVSSKLQAPTPSKTQIQRDDDGTWRIIINKEDSSVHIDRRPSPLKQQQEERVDGQEDLIVEEEDVHKSIEDLDKDSSSSLFVVASETFLTLEDRIMNEGYTTELVDELLRVAATRKSDKDMETANDWAFAVTRLSYMQLFEPSTESVDEQTFIDALHNLNIAAEAGVQSALGVLAMLDLVGVPTSAELENPSLPPLSLNEKRVRADKTLKNLSDANYFMATIAVGYGTLSGRIPVPLKVQISSSITGADPVCEAALPLYHKSAEENVHIIVEEGGERPVKIPRLSDEVLEPHGGFLEDYGFGGADPLHDENAALHELEYYRTIANNPMDEQYPQAMQRLGEVHFFGNPAAHVAADHELAAQYFRQAADAGDALAQANYGMLLANGMGVQQDVPHALVYFDRAVRQNEAFAFHGLGVLYFTGAGIAQNVTLALEYFEKAIARGYAESHSFLGSAYLHGDGGVPVDYAMAFSHFQTAVDGTNGHSSQALFNLGVMHFQGVGTAPSCSAALPLFRTVALHPDLLSTLPFSLIKAHECYKKDDYLRAYLHYRLVAELGDEDGQCNAAYLLEHHADSILKWRWLGLAESTEHSSNPALGEAFTLYSQAAALNDSEAIRKIGACFHEPWIGVCQSNHTRALERYQLAAELGDAQAGYKSGMMLLTGDGVAQDLVAARSYYAECSEALFPGNVPCVLALLGLDTFQAVEGIIQQIWVSGN